MSIYISQFLHIFRKCYVYSLTYKYDQDLSSSGNVDALHKRSMVILKNMIEVTSEIDEKLFQTPRKMLTENSVLACVNRSVKPYSDAFQFYKELLALFEAAGGMQKMETKVIKGLKRSLQDM